MLLSRVTAAAGDDLNIPGDSWSFSACSGAETCRLAKFGTGIDSLLLRAGTALLTEAGDVCECFSSTGLPRGEAMRLCADGKVGEGMLDSLA